MQWETYFYEENCYFPQFRFACQNIISKGIGIIEAHDHKRIENGHQ